MKIVGGIIDKDKSNHQITADSEVEPASALSDRQYRPLLRRAVVLMFISIFVVEALLMVLLPVLSLTRAWTTIIFDASLAALCILPCLYFVVLKPLKSEIAQRRRAENAARESESRYRSLYHSTPAMLHSIDSQGRLVSVSDCWLDKMGYQLDEVIGHRSTEFLTTESAQFAREVILPEFMRTGECHRVPYRFVKKNGEIMDVLLSAISEKNADGTVLRSMAVIEDVTERVRGEQRELRKAQLDSILVRIYGEAVSLPDREFCDYAMDQAVALTRSKIGFFHKISDDQKEIILTAWNGEALKGCTAAYDTHYPIEVAGNWVDCIRQGRPVIYNDFPSSPNQKGLPAGHSPVRRFLSVPVMEGDKVRLVFGVGNKEDAYDEIDATHLQLLAVELIKILRQRESERMLKTSEDRFRAMSENALTGIWIVQDGLIKYTNPILAKLLECSADKLAGSDPLAQFHIDDRPAMEVLLKEGGNQRSQARQIAVRAVNRAATQIDFEVAASYIEWDGRCAVLCNLLNITETKRLRELEARAQRLETVGRIAGQVAHDFNNLLGPVMAYPELIRGEIPINNDVYEYLNAIESAAHQIAAINQDLLTLGRRGHYSVELLNLNSIIKESLKELEPLPATVICEVDLSPDLMSVKGGVAQIRRAISNLLHNAHDALNDVGKISIRTENYYADDVTVGYGRVPKGEYVKITIADTGIGMPENILQRIFEPFFTMKTADRRRGSGLGLSVVDSVIKDHGGFVDLNSKVGQGTKFYLYLPACREQETIERSEEIKGGSESILIVDDDAMQRGVLARILSKLGYRTAQASSGEEAIDLLRQATADLLLLDMIMPGGIDGSETFRQALEICPGQRAIIVSGFSESDRVNEMQACGAGAFVKKPLTIRAIATAVRKELDRGTERAKVHSNEPSESIGSRLTP